MHLCIVCFVEETWNAWDMNICGMLLLIIISMAPAMFLYTALFIIIIISITRIIIRYFISLGSIIDIENTLTHYFFGALNKMIMILSP